MSEDQLKKVCDQAGVQYCGIQSGRDVQYILFTDMITGSTLALEKKEFSNAKIQARVAFHRQKFGDDVHFLSDIFDATKFITRKKVLPRGVILKAAHAAVDVIMQYLKEQKEQGNGTSEDAA